LDHGADPNYKTSAGLTPLMRAGRSAYIEIIRLLLDHSNIELDATSNNGQTALMFASPSTSNSGSVEIENRRSDIVRLLLDAGADPLIESNSGRTALQLTKPMTPAYTLLGRADIRWSMRAVRASQDLQYKFMVARRLRQGTNTTEGTTLQLSERHLAEGIIRKAEYDNLCKGLQTNLNKPGVVALAKSLKINTLRQTKSQLCNEIANKLII
jgi:hypothetical protein